MRLVTNTLLLSRVREILQLGKASRDGIGRSSRPLYISLLSVREVLPAYLVWTSCLWPMGSVTAVVTPLYRSNQGTKDTHYELLRGSTGPSGHCHLELIFKYVLKDSDDRNYRCAGDHLPEIQPLSLTLSSEFLSAGVFSGSSLGWGGAGKTSLSLQLWSAAGALCALAILAWSLLCCYLNVFSWHCFSHELVRP